MIRQGDVYWLDSGVGGDQPALRHPYVVIQNDVYNASAIQTALVCLLTSNLKLAGAPGNVMLRQGEANLPKTCVANVTQVYTVAKVELADYLGSLSPARIAEIVAGIGRVVQPRAWG